MTLWLLEYVKTSGTDLKFEILTASKGEVRRV